MRIALTVVCKSRLRKSESAAQAEGRLSLGLVSVAFIIVTSASPSQSSW